MSLFFLGTHHPHWLGLPQFADVPLFVSHRRLRGYKTLPRAAGTWALDSGGFTELSMHGKWITTADEYAAAIVRYRDDVGGLLWCAPQDWMCEHIMLAKTGLTVRDHQERTVASYCDLAGRGLPVIPVLQGWTEGDYYDCWELYQRAGVDLTALPVVGLGTVCRRQNTSRASFIVTGLHMAGLRLHGFGFKRTGLASCGEHLASSDSLAWSYHARHEPPMHECIGTHKNCANCPRFALEWRADMLEKLATEYARANQLSLTLSSSEITLRLCNSPR